MMYSIKCQPSLLVYDFHVSLHVFTLLSIIKGNEKDTFLPQILKTSSLKYMSVLIYNFKLD